MTRDRASSTAILIAACQIIHRYSGAAPTCVSDESLVWAKRFLGLTTRSQAMRLLAGSRMGRRIARAVEWLLLPGIIAHHAIRKADVELAVVEAMQHATASKLLVCGAGFDSLAVRLRTRGLGLQHIELDHPGTQRVKIIDDSFASSSVETIECDLADNDAINRVMTAASVRPNVILIEGVLMYLHEPRVRQLLTTLAEAAAPGATLVMSCMHLVEGKPAFHRRRRLVAGILSLSGERMHWGIAPGDMHAFLRDTGWELHHTQAPSLPDGQPACPGEILAVAHKQTA